MGRHRIAVISDTHGLLRDEVMEVLGTCELILHGGDINTRAIVDRLRETAPLYIVRGNNDKEWAADIPMTETVDFHGFRFFMCHKRKDVDTYGIPAGTDFVIYGHSHKYEMQNKPGTCFLNPGSCGPRRFVQPVTMAVITLDDTDHTYTIEKLDLSPVLTKDTAKSAALSDKDLDKLITLIIKDMNSGKSVAETAKRNRVDEELADSVYRMYSTHQGIDIAGIIDRLELRNVYGK